MDRVRFGRRDAACRLPGEAAKSDPSSVAQGPSTPSILDAADAIVVVLDPHGRIVFCNSTCERLTGFVLSHVRGRTLWEAFTAEEGRAAERSIYAALSASEQTARYDSPIVTATGERRLLSWSCSPVYGDGTGVRHIVATGIDVAARREAEQARALQGHDGLLQAIPDILYVIDRLGRLVRWNRRLEHVTQLAANQIKDSPLHRFFPPRYHRLVHRAVRRAFRTGHMEGEVELLGAGNTCIPYHFNGVPLHDDTGEIVGLTGVGRDISDRRRLDAELRQTEAHFRVLAENAPTGVGLAVDRFVYVNGSMEVITGYRKAELLCMRPADLGLSTSGGEVGGRAELRMRTSGGDEKWVLVSENTIAYRGENARLINLTDVTERKRLERELREYATIDHLTRAYNRAEFERRMHSEIKRVNRYGGNLSLIMFDIDHFKQINDAGGHHVGDNVLRALTQLIQRNIRASDHLGRWGGEEFMILSPAMELGDAVGFAVKLRSFVADHPFSEFGPVTASFGVAQYCTGESAESFVRRSDGALYRAKKNGRNRVEVETRC